MDTCPSCNGSGEYSIGDCEDGVNEMCPDCNGSGCIEEA